MGKQRDDGYPDKTLMAALADGLVPIEPGAEARARMACGLMAKVRAGKSGFLTVHAHEGAWVDLTAGVQIKLLREDDESRSFLLRMDPGAELPAHDHPSDEECFVLEGDVTLAGVVCRAGDYQLAPAGRDHDHARSERGCVLLIRGARANRALTRPR